MNFVKINPGTFLMGSPETEGGRWSDETQHSVTITQPLEMQTTQVTQKQWVEIMEDNPSYFKGNDLPVEQVSWDDAQDFIHKLNAQGRDNYVYRLPTEAEWEYCARAGSSSSYSFGDFSDRLQTYGWFSYNSNNKTHPAGRLVCNIWGLYDMHGNVWEWCQDWYGKYDLNGSIQGPASGSFRVIRGGGRDDDARGLRSAQRNGFGPANRSSVVGFRLCRTENKICKLPLGPFTLDQDKAAGCAEVLKNIRQIRAKLSKIEKLLK